MGVIYLATNLKNNKKYVGKTIGCLNRRKEGHLKSAFKKNSNHIFHKALRKYGEESFVWTILFFDKNATHEQLNELEKKFIIQNNSFSKLGYNMSEGGNGGDLISHHPLKEQIIAKISKGKGMFGKRHSERSKMLISRSLKGKPNYKNRGENNAAKREDIRKKISEGVRNSISHKTAIASPLYRARLREAIKNSEKFQRSKRNKEKSEKIKKALAFVMPKDIGDDIIKFYCVDKFTIVQITKKVNLSHHLISRFFKQNGIKIQHSRTNKKEFCYGAE